VLLMKAMRLLSGDLFLAGAIRCEFRSIVESCRIRQRRFFPGGDIDGDDIE
jgi:hypothetical protein